MDVLAPLLPSKYAPLRSIGTGLQSVYLTRLPEALAAALIDLIGVEARDIIRGNLLLEGGTSPAIGLLEREEHEKQEIRNDTHIPETEREAIVLARRGQGTFKANVMRIERACRITGVTREEHLRASHCKPWRDSSNTLSPALSQGRGRTSLNADHLFDRGFIGFEDNGDVLVSPVAHAASLVRLGVQVTQSLNVGRFSEGQRRYLRFHRDSVLLKSKYLEDA